MATMYPAIVNSPQTTLSSGIDAVQTVIGVVGVTKLPAAPNLATLGSGENAETILYAGIDGNQLTGVTRGFQGAAKAWDINTVIYRAFTAYDHDAFKANISLLREQFVNVKYYAAGDGATNDTSSITDAVSNAYNNGSYMYWPEGTYLTTASIPHLHEVRHFGPGKIQRGTDIFSVHILPGATNILYISTTGNDTNDGLSSNEPVQTFQYAFDILKNYGSVLEGIWQIKAAAGAYSINAGAHTHATPSVNRVMVLGADVGGHPNVPTTIIDGTGGGGYQHGLRFAENTRVWVQDIKFQNFTAVPSGTRIGLDGDTGSDVYTRNVHATNCDWAGIFQSGGIARIQGGILEGNVSGFVAYNSRATVGYGGSAALNRPIIRNNTTNGICYTGVSMGHIDYCDIEDNVIGVLVDHNSRVHGVNNNYKRNNYHVRLETGGRYFKDMDIFNEGTVDSSVMSDMDIKAFCGEISEHRLAYSEMRVEIDRNTYTHTGTTDKTVVATPYTVPAYRLKAVTSKLRIKVYGIFTSASALTSIGVDLGATQVSLLAVAGTPAANTGFIAEFELFPITLNSQRVVGCLSASGLNNRIANGGVAADNSIDLDLKVTAKLGGASDTIVINRVEVFITG